MLRRTTVLSLWCCVSLLGAGVAFGEDSEEPNDAPSSAPHLEASQSFFNGSARYTYPIAVPAGTAGAAPSVSLSYTSHAQWSNTGYGWSLTGVDEISRSSKCGVPTLDDSDVFVWQGQELVRDAAGLYHTAKEGFARIERIGDGATSSWLVTLPNGLRYRYGGTENSRIMAHENGEVVHRWALDRVEDPNGNYYTVEYLRDDASAAYYPQTITYTRNDSSPGERGVSCGRCAIYSS